MTGVYYWMQHQFELDLLKENLKNSACTGFHIPNDFFDNPKTKASLKESFALLGKEIQLDFDYASKLRPSLWPLDSMLERTQEEKDLKKAKSDLKKKEEMIFSLKKMQLISECQTFVDSQYAQYQEVETFLNQPESCLNPIESLLFDNASPSISLGPFDFPFIPPLPPYNPEKRDDLIEIENLITKVNENFFEIQSSDSRFQECFFNITISQHDLLEKTEYYLMTLDRAQDFSRIMLWIVDFNEIYVDKKFLNPFHDLLKNLKNEDKICVIKHAGIYTHHLLSNFGNQFSSIVHLDGYPGHNINILYRPQKNKRWFDPITGEFFNITNIGDRMDEKYHCTCEICASKRITSYNRAKGFFLGQEPEKSSDYTPYIGKAKKTAAIKIHKIQNRNLLKHCFFNIDHVLNMPLGEFKKQFVSSRLYSIWEPYYAKG
ncbi:MAG TPA: hypothetical protein VKM55_00655 [Candidatus Lokiarchaeia archaeon]|nr:hypothetical protein [Candidatus Lokiarchaeia archaeon]